MNLNRESSSPIVDDVDSLPTTESEIASTQEQQNDSDLLISPADYTPYIWSPELNQALESFTDPASLSAEDRAKQVKAVAEIMLKQIQEQVLSNEEFSRQQRAELARINPYYQAFARVFDEDLKSIKFAREQLSGSLMNSGLLVIPMFSAIFDKGSGSFFESRESVVDAAGQTILEFRANGALKFEDLIQVFSVLSTFSEDDEGRFEVDYPVYRIPAEIFFSLANNEAGQDLLTEFAEICSYRIHDWIHAVFLYDREAVDPDFIEWSKQIFFTEHLFTEGSKINYELMSDVIHFSVWQDIFKQDPEAKKDVLSKLDTVLTQISSRQGNEQELQPGQLTPELTRYMAFLTVRSLYHVIKFDDPELDEVIAKNGFDPNYFREAAFKSSSEVQPYLSKLYEFSSDPTRAVFNFGDQKLTFKEIIGDYIKSLKQEFELRLDRQKASATIDLLMTGDLVNRYEFPDSVQIVLDQTAAELHPQVLTQLNEVSTQIANEYSPEVRDQIFSMIEKDGNGVMYLKLDRADFDMTKAQEVQHQKQAFLIQVPPDHSPVRVELQRGSRLGVSVEGASQTANPGDIILINITDQSVLLDLVESATTTKGFDFDLFWQNLDKKRATHPEIGDMYPYKSELVLERFELPTTDLNQLSAGVYSTKKNTRRAARMPGPVSVESMLDPDYTRLKIISGAIVAITEDDIFPVTEEVFANFYGKTLPDDLPPVEFTQAFVEKFNSGSRQLDKTELTDLLANVSNELYQMYVTQIYGARGGRV